MHYNSFLFCPSYGMVYDDVSQSDESHNYMFDCALMNELDSSGTQTLYQDTVNYNYVGRDNDAGDSYGGDNVFNYKIGCGQTDCSGCTNSSGCSATGNVINGENGDGYPTGYFNGETQWNGTFSGNYCFNGCECLNGTNSGCIASAP
jgi:hypothetical protein